MASHVLVEICIASVEDARAAERGGAGRLELNAALELGGLTPSVGMIREVRRATRLPIITMIRPRPGGFCYDDAEFEVMRRDVDAALEAGSDGLALGILLRDGRVDAERCASLIAQAGAAPVIFHRAFDYTPDSIAALDELIALGIERVMTSGQKSSAMEGASLIAALHARAAGRIEVLPAGGIRPPNVAELVARTGCTQVHASLRGACQDPSLSCRRELPLGAPADPGTPMAHGATSVDRVRELCAALGL